jgi:hypothetical protein
MHKVTRISNPDTLTVNNYYSGYNNEVLKGIFSNKGVSKYDIYSETDEMYVGDTNINLKMNVTEIGLNVNWHDKRSLFQICGDYDNLFGVHLPQVKYANGKQCLTTHQAVVKNKKPMNR